MRINLSKPHIAFIGIWALTYVLFRLRLTSNIVETTFDIDYLVAMSCMFAFIIFHFVGQGSNSDPLRNISAHHVKRLTSFQFLLGTFWVVGTAIDIVYSNGVPILWAIQGNGRNYTEFGIPSFHGIVNAAYLFWTTSLFLKFMLTGRKRLIFWIAVLLTWPLFMLGRGILLSAVVQMAGVYLMVRPVRVRGLLMIGVLMFLGVIAFGYMGDLRSGGQVLAYLADPGSILTELPSGFLWVYVYITTGINNVAHSVGHFSPLGEPFFSILNLLPSVYRMSLDGENLNLGLMQIVDRNLNTSSFYAGYLSDFGMWGGLFAPCLLMTVACFSYRSGRRGKIGSLIAYTILFQCIIFSPFNDMLLQLPTLAQLAIGFVCNMFLSSGKKSPARQVIGNSAAQVLRANATSEQA